MSRARPAAVLALVALLLFVATALWTQFARSDLDWVRVTLSLYLHGPWGWHCALPTACWRWPLRRLALRCIAAASGRAAVRRRRCCSLSLRWGWRRSPSVTAGCLKRPRCLHRSSMDWQPTPRSCVPASACCCRLVPAPRTGLAVRRGPALGLGMAGLRAAVAACAVAWWTTAWAGTESGDRGDRWLAAVSGDGPVPAQPSGRSPLNPQRPAPVRAVHAAAAYRVRIPSGMRHEACRAGQGNGCGSGVGSTAGNGGGQRAAVQPRAVRADSGAHAGWHAAACGDLVP